MRCTLIIPARDESELIEGVLYGIRENVDIEFECLIVVDTEFDQTIPLVRSISNLDSRFKIIINSLGSGPAMAIRTGMKEASSDVLVVTMADGSDDARDIPKLVRLVERGVDVACASRYMPTGQQIGAPLLKALLSRIAGKSLSFVARVGTRDATNSFKAYRSSFIAKVGIDSSFGFEIGIEMVAKAKRNGGLVAEIPTVWIERTAGESKFVSLAWMKEYLRWYLYAIGFGKK